MDSRLYLRHDPQNLSHCQKQLVPLLWEQVWRLINSNPDRLPSDHTGWQVPGGLRDPPGLARCDRDIPKSWAPVRGMGLHR